MDGDMLVFKGKVMDLRYFVIGFFFFVFIFVVIMDYLIFMNNNQNNVDIDKEMSFLVENQLCYNVYI